MLRLNSERSYLFEYKSTRLSLLEILVFFFYVSLHIKLCNFALTNLVNFMKSQQILEKALKLDFLSAEEGIFYLKIHLRQN